ncbi:hypothetical protein HOY82DRAFT_485462, partial [Tuber indicum]
KGAPIANMCGFIDDTICGIAWPTKCKRTYFNGWKRKHCHKYHAIVTPDGLISHLFGPVNGWQNDAFQMHESNLPNILEQHAQASGRTLLQRYGDPAYSIH